MNENLSSNIAISCIEPQISGYFPLNDWELCSKTDYCTSAYDDLVCKVKRLENNVTTLKNDLDEYKKINAQLSTALYTLIGEIQKEKFLKNERN